MPINGAICACVSFACLRTSRGAIGAWTMPKPSPLAWASASLKGLNQIVAKGAHVVS